MVAILDIDGTLVDTNYQHALAWYRAFRAQDITLPIWQIHRHVGMGGDQLVVALTDEETDERCGDALRDAHDKHYQALIDEVAPMKGSRQLIEELRRRGHKVILASSASEEEANHYLDLLDARELANDWTTSGDVETTKPAPDLVAAALKKADAPASEGVMIGDTPWDVRAAAKAGVPTLAVLTGGFGEEELRDSGAAAVFESVLELREALEDTPLR